eukprot:TRINITY_DN12448_c0_g1_i1.p1 TRINITY_DN12448_c0_g1~~TRINITY_DN12448_c0_g1_i1.p1  ORF type:complete len:752 (+),score=247.06 TRINITY_DN12448_c0_g1_i1:37-2256(+)
MSQNWIRVQQKTFTRWTNTYLVERMMKCEDLQTDLGDGILLANLLEIISSKTIKHNKKPKMVIQKLENLNFCLDFLKREGIKLVNIDSTVINEGNLKLILGLIWTIILRYQIQVSEGNSAKQELLEWVRTKIPEYNINNFKGDWTSGKAICALAEAVLPGQMSLPNDFTNNPVADARMAMNKAEENMNIPQILDPEDMVQEPDELSNMTYISYFRDYLDMEQRRKDAELFERTPVAVQCIAYGPGLEDGNEAGIETNFTIEARNGAGRKVPIGGHSFPVDIVAPDGSSVPSQTVDNGDGTYAVTYTASQPGKHNVGITFNGDHIGKSPYPVLIKSGMPDPTQCRIFGPGIEGAEAHVPTNFTIEARNRLGDKINNGGSPFVTKITNDYGDELPVDQVDNGDGTYTVSYTPNSPGEVTVDVTLLHKPVADSAYKVPVGENTDMASPSKSWAEGPGLEGGNKAGDPAEFTIHAKTPAGAPALNGDDFEVHVEAPDFSLVPAEVKNNGDGTYSVTYTPEEPGNYHVDVILRNKADPLYYDHVKNSPIDVVIDAGTSANNTIAYGPGLEEGNLDTFPATFTIEARDKQDRKMTEGGDPFEVTVMGPSGPIEAAVTDNGDGTYDVVYNPEEPGVHDISVELDGEPIKGSTFHVDIKPGAWPANTSIDSYQFTIVTRDKRNTAKTVGGENVKVLINQGAIEAQLNDNGDGTYTATYSLPEAGQYQFNVQLNDQDIKGSPFIQTVG